MNLLEGRLALITGGARGIGAATVRAMVAAGARVIIADKNVEAAGETARSIDPTGDRVSVEPLDVTDRAAIAALAATVEGRHGDISILVNNAGFAGELPLDDDGLVDLWDRMIEVNLTSVMLVTRAFLPSLRRTKGNVVNVSSVAAFVAPQGSYSYNASKAGVKLLTQTLARQLGPEGIRVNAVGPGTVRTDLTAPRMRRDPVWTEQVVQRVPLGRIGDPEDIADPIVFLASDWARFVTGTVLVADGGYLAV